MPSDGAGCWINLKGRERDGIVDPGEAESLLDEIAAGLSTFIEPSGQKMITSVVRSSALEAPGPKSLSLPDLVVLWSPHPEAGLRVVRSPRFGDVVRDGVGSGRSGNHCEERGLRRRADRGRMRQARGPVRRDLASTVCAVMDVPCDDLPGRSLLH